MQARRFAILAALVTSFLAVNPADAQPSDSKVKKDLKSPKSRSIKLVGRGRVELNTDTLVREYIRGAEIVLDSEYKGIKVVVTGDAVYQMSGKKYRYWKFRVFENRYLGLPDPSPQQIATLLATDPVARVGEGFANDMVKIVEDLKLADKPQWVWHTPMSVSFKMVGIVDKIASATEVERERVVWDVRLYRDTIDGPWTKFLSSPSTREKLGTTTHTTEQIRNMPRLRQQIAEVAAKEAASKRQAVTIPSFASAEEMTRFLHKVLREGPRDKADAILRAMIAPRHYAPGSTVLLGHNAEQMIVDTLDAAFGATPYAQQYCAAAGFETRGSQTVVAVIGVNANIVSSFTGRQAGGKLVDGVEVGAKWMLDDVKLRVKNDQATLTWIASFSDRKKLCPND
jgi:hypothetical protein